MRIFFVILVSVTLFSSGCAWMGETAGKVQAKVERKTGAVQDGYDRGYEDEKAKTGNKK